MNFLKATTLNEYIDKNLESDTAYYTNKTIYNLL